MDENGSVTLFFVNKDMADAIEVSVDLRDFGQFNRVEHSLLYHDDVKEINTEDNPDTVSPRPEMEASWMEASSPSYCQALAGTWSGL